MGCYESSILADVLVILLPGCFQCGSSRLSVADPFCCPSLKEVHLSVKGVPGQLTINSLESACKQRCCKTRSQDISLSPVNVSAGPCTSL